MNVPENLKYTAEHEWIRVEGDEIVVGVTDFAQGELELLVESREAKGVLGGLKRLFGG